MFVYLHTLTIYKKVLKLGKYVLTWIRTSKKYFDTNISSTTRKQEIDEKDIQGI